MILIDFQQLLFTTLMAQIRDQPIINLDLNMFRHMTLESIRHNNMKHKNKYGRLVIACDSGNYWRKQLFPFYKSNRKQIMEKSPLDWKVIYEYVSIMKQELSENFNYPIIDIPSVEADDIIATLTKRFGTEEINFGEQILIISSDKDFIQLQKYGNVQQYSPKMSKWITHPNPDLYLKEHILRGDRGDGIPNFLSQDDSFVSGVRQKSIQEKKMEVWLTQNIDEFCEGQYIQYYERNRNLIDFDCIPLDIQNKINAVYDEQIDKHNKGKLMNYFINKKLGNFMPMIGDF